MLSSSPSLLLSTLSPLPVVGEAIAPAAVKAASGFANLLSGLATKAVEAISGEDGDAQGDAEQAIAGDAPAVAKDKTTTPRAGRQAVDAKAPAAEDKGAIATQPAAAALAAIESGKILPVTLPEAAATGDATQTETLAVGATDTPTALPVLPGALPVQTASPEPAPAVATPSRRTTDVAARTLAHKVNAAPSQPADRAKPDVRTPEARTPDARPTPAVTITVAAPAQAPLAETADAAAKPAAPVRAKPTRAADLARIELPQLATPAPAATPFAAVDQTVQPVAAPVPAMSAAMPSPNDIDAALDHLVAAREALMPAEAALAIDHAEFGEVSIKFEQSSDGQLSAELTAADPELKRAVTAAVAADRGPATTPDGDNRSAQLANQRGSASAGGDAANGGRGQSGAQSGAERELPQRRSNSQARQAPTDPRSGIFA